MSDPQAPLPPEAPRASRGRAFALAAGAAVAIALVVLAVGGIGENLVYYWGPAEIEDAGQRAVGATIRLGGLVGEDSIVLHEGGTGLEFDVVDAHSRVHVKASGVAPQMFREGIGVVVEGTMTPAGHFAAHRLMVSHDNEYRAPEEGEMVDARRQMRTTQGLDEESR